LKPYSRTAGVLKNNIIKISDQIKLIIRKVSEKHGNKSLPPDLLFDFAGTIIEKENLLFCLPHVHTVVVVADVFVVVDD